MLCNSFHFFNAAIFMASAAPNMEVENMDCKNAGIELQLLETLIHFLYLIRAI